MKNSVETILDSFTQIRKVYANILHKRFKEENFTPNEISVLILLANNKSIHTSTQITLFLNVSKGLVSRSIISLMHRELIVCVRDEEDKRIQHIYLTDKADEVIQRLEKEMNTINEVMLKNISNEEITQMKETMSKIMNCFKGMEDINEIKNV